MDSHSRRHFLLTAFAALSCPLSPMNVKAALTSRVVSSCLWRRLQGTGLERFDLLREANGWTLRGTILSLSERGPAEARYSLSCDVAWRTQHAYIWFRDHSGDRCSRVVVDNGRWIENGHERKDLACCIDIDLGWSPSTNTIAIRRLNLPVGAQSGPLTMAWVPFPELSIEPLPQQYLRISEHRYRYRSRGGGFSALIDVDDEGLVVEYEGVWQRVGETHDG